MDISAPPPFVQHECSTSSYSESRCWLCCKKSWPYSTGTATPTVIDSKHKHVLLTFNRVLSKRPNNRGSSCHGVTVILCFCYYSVIALIALIALSATTAKHVVTRRSPLVAPDRLQRPMPQWQCANTCDEPLALISMI